MSIKIMTLVWDTEIGPATKRLVLLALADAANDEGSCFMLIKTLARKAIAGESTIQRVLGELESEGLLTREFRQNRSTIFHLNLVALRSQIEGGSQIETPGVPDRDPNGSLGSQIETHNRTTNQEKEPSPDAVAPEQQSLVPAVSGAKEQGRKTDERGKQPAAGANGLTINQVATRLAQAHYERLGKMGRVPAFVQIIRKAVERDFTPEQITAALEYLAENRWTLTEEKLANALRGGPQRPTRPAPGAASHARDHLPETKRGVNQWGKPTHYPSGRAILYSSTGAEIQQ
jgi:hypothetical protein